jgi:hypothetical protein
LWKRIGTEISPKFSGDDVQLGTSGKNALWDNSAETFSIGNALSPVATYELTAGVDVAQLQIYPGEAFVGTTTVTPFGIAVGGIFSIYCIPGGNVGIGVSPDVKLHIFNSDTGVVPGAEVMLMIEDNVSTPYFQIATAIGSYGGIYIGDSNNYAYAGISGEIGNQRLALWAGALAINFGVTIIEFNADGIDVDYQFRTDNYNDTLFIDGGTDRVGIRTATPDHPLDVRAEISIFGESASLARLRLRGFYAADPGDPPTNQTDVIVVDNGVAPVFKVRYNDAGVMKSATLVLA